MASFDYRIELYDNTGVLSELLNLKVSGCRWVYSRIGGCDEAIIRIKAAWTDYSTVTSIWKIKITIRYEGASSYSAVYIGNILSKNKAIDDPEYLEFHCMGYMSQLARTIIYQHPDTGDPANYSGMTIKEILTDIVGNYITPYTDITSVLGDIDDPAITPSSILFDTNALNAIQLLATMAGNYEWGVDGTGAFYFKAKSTTRSFNLFPGNDITIAGLEEDSSNIINRIYFSGGYDLNAVLENQNDATGIAQLTYNTTYAFGKTSTYKELMQTFTGVSRIKDVRFRIGKTGFTNLFTDGDMEAAGVTAWLDYGSGIKTKVKRTDVPYEATQYLYVDAKSSTGVKQSFSLSGGSTYTLSIATKTKGGRSPLRIQIFDISNQEEIHLSEKLKSKTWTLQTITFSVNGTGTKTVEIRFFGSCFMLDAAKLTVEQDDLELTLVNAAIPGTALKTIMIPGTQISASAQEIIIDLCMDFLTPATTYGLQLKREGAESDSAYYFIDGADSSLYAGGTLKHWDGDSWEDLSVDAYFNLTWSQSQVLYGVRSERIKNTAIASIEDARLWANSFLGGRDYPQNKGLVQIGMSKTYWFEQNKPIDLCSVRSASGTQTDYLIDRITYEISENGLTIGLELGTRVPKLSDYLGWIEYQIDQLRQGEAGTESGSSGSSGTVDNPGPVVPTTPPDVASGSVIGQVGNVLINIGQVADAAGYIVYVFTSVTPASAVVIKRIEGNPASALVNLGEVSETGSITILPDISLHWWITALDRFGNESANKFYLGTAAPLKKAVPLPDSEITFLAHYDGPLVNGDYTGSPVDVYGTAPTVRTGGVIFPNLGRFGKGFQSAVAVTNLCVNPSFEVNVSDGWAHSGFDTAERSNIHSKYGSYSLRQVDASIDGDEYSNSASMAATAGLVYTFGIWIKKLTATGTGRLMIAWYQSDDTPISQDTLNLDSGTHDWKRYALTATAPALTGKAIILVDTIGVTAASAWEIYIDGVDFIQSSWDLPHCDGSLGDGHTWSGTVHNSTSSRTAAILAYNANIFPQDIGTAIIYYKPVTATQSGVGLSRVFFDLRDGSHANSMVFYRSSATGLFTIVVNGTTYGCDSLALIPYTDYFLVVEWDFPAGILQVWCNDVVISDNAGDDDFNPTPFYHSLLGTGTNIYIGSNYSSAQQANGILDEVCFINRRLTADERTAIFQSAAPIFDISSKLRDQLPPLPNPPEGMANGTVTVVNAQNGKMETLLEWHVCVDSGGGKVDYEVEWSYESDLTRPKSIKKGFLITGDHVYLLLDDLESSATKASAYWRVRAKDEHNNWGSFCAIQTITLTDAANPGSIASITATGGVGQIELKWPLSSSLKIHGYRIYINISASQTGWETITKVAHGDFKTGTQYGRVTIPVGAVSDSSGFTVAYDTAYFFSVTPVDRAGNETTASAPWTSAAKAIHLEVLKHFNYPWKQKTAVLRKYADTSAHSPSATGDGKVWALENYQLDSGKDLSINTYGIDQGVIKRKPKYNAGIFLDSGDTIQMSGPVTDGYFRVREYDALSYVTVIAVILVTTAGPSYDVTYEVPVGKQFILTHAFSFSSNSGDIQVSVDSEVTWQTVIDDVYADPTTAGDGVFVFPAESVLRAFLVGATAYLHIYGVEVTDG